MPNGSNFRIEVEEQSSDGDRRTMPEDTEMMGGVFYGVGAD
jgi:hypothetical protein